MNILEKYSGFTKTLQLVSLFLERRGCSIVAVQKVCDYHKNFVATDGVDSVLVAIYNTGALDITGAGGGKLRAMLETFRTVVGPKPKGAK